MKRIKIIFSYALLLFFLGGILIVSCRKTVELKNELPSSKLSGNAIQPVSVQNNSIRTVGYFSTHATGGQDWGKWIDSFDVSQYSDIIIAFINPDASGNFQNTASMTQAVTKARNAGVARVFFGIATSDAASNANNQIARNRAKFISNIRSFLTDNNFDGIDLDFEGKGLTDNFNAFVIQLADSLAPYSKKISVAIARWQANAISNAAYNRIDYLNVMSYDHAVSNGGKPHSTYSDFIADFNTFHPKMSNNASKINMGVPAYAWVYINDVPTEQYGYGNVIQANPNSGHCLNHIKTNNGTWKWYYDGFPAIRQKVAFAKQKSIGGIMVWHVLADANKKKDTAKNLIRFVNYCIGNASGFYPGSYRINNTNSGKTLQIAGGSNANASLAIQGNGDTQGTHLWKLHYLEGTKYGIINNYSDKALDVSETSVAPGGYLAQWSWWDQATNQQFSLVADALGYYTITAVHSNLPIQIRSASMNDGAQVEQNNADGSWNQKWMISD